VFDYQNRAKPPSRQELIATAREIHVPGQGDVDALLRRMANELEQITERQQAPVPRELTVSDLMPVRHADGHPMSSEEHAWYASYLAAHEVGAGHVDSARFATRQVFEDRWML
jgi:hypothetical protein